MTNPIMETIEKLNRRNTMSEFAQLIRKEVLPEIQTEAKTLSEARTKTPFDPIDPETIKFVEALNKEGVPVTLEQVSSQPEMSEIQFWEQILTALEKGGEEGEQAMGVFIAMGKATGEIPEDFDWKHPTMEFYTIDDPEERVLMDHVPGHGYVAHEITDDPEN